MATNSCIIIHKIFVALSLVCLSAILPLTSRVIWRHLTCYLVLPSELFRSLGKARGQGTSRNEGGRYSHLYRWKKMRVGLQASQVVLWCGLHCSLSRWKGTNFDNGISCPLYRVLPLDPLPPSKPLSIFSTTLPLPPFFPPIFILFPLLPLLLLLQSVFYLLPITLPPLFLLPRPLFRLLPPHRH